MALFNTLVKKRTISNSEQYNNTNHHRHHHDTELGNDHQQVLMSSDEDNKNIHHHHHHTSLSSSTLHKPLSYVDSYSSSSTTQQQQQHDMKQLNTSSFDGVIPASQSLSTSLHSRNGSNNTNTSMNSSSSNNITNRKEVQRHIINDSNINNNNNRHHNRHNKVSSSSGSSVSSSSFLDDCESGISMNCKCRKATLMITFGIAIIITFYSNISLVIKLGSQQYYNTNTGGLDGSTTSNHNPYLFDETYHHLQQMIHSYPVGENNNNINRHSKGEDTNKIEEMVGDDDDPLEEEQQQDEDEEDNNNNNNDDEETNNHNGDDSIDMSTSDITSSNSNISSSPLSLLSSRQKSNTMKRSRPRNRSKNNMGRLVKNNNYKIKKIQQQKNRNHNNLGRNSNHRKHPIVKNNARANIMDIEPTVQAMSVNASFSACLLIKDDNDILNEWIAYHYHTIKLRHLIVAIDPLSSQSPTALLAKWKLMTDLNIRIWYDKHYMPTEFVQTNMAPSEFIATETDLKNSKMRTESIIEISNHRYRQRIFLASCLRSMRAEGNSWVIHIDTDEYVVPSKLLRQMKPRYVVIPPIEEPGSVLSLIQQVVEKTGRNVNYPCISMLRVLFGSVESSIEEQSVGVPSPYNATAFESLRWRYHALPHSAELHGNPKVILDVQAIPEKYFDETIVFSIHRPVRQYCPKNSDLAFSNFRKQPIAVNHYLGSWERYSGRNDKRRSRDKYDMKASVNRGHDDGLRLWLHGFVETMGAENASILLGEQYLLHYYENDSNNNTSSLENIQQVSTFQTKQSNSILHIEPIPLQKHLLDTDTIAQ